MITQSCSCRMRRFAGAPVRVAVVGTAGRNRDDASALCAESMCWMEHEVERVLHSRGMRIGGDRRVVLVSGGSAWADHVAVRLFLLHVHRIDLELELPCAFDWGRRRFVDTGSADWRTNPGRALNRYHAAHSAVVGSSTFDDLVSARALGAVVREPGVGRCTRSVGFHTRNSAVAQGVEILVAFTFSAGAAPRRGGTLDTWTKCVAEKVHRTIPRNIHARGVKRSRGGAEHAGKKPRRVD